MTLCEQGVVLGCGCRGLAITYTWTMRPPIVPTWSRGPLSSCNGHSSNILPIPPICLLVTFFLFPLLKRQLRGKTFPNVAALKDAVKDEIAAVTAVQWR